MRGQFGVLGPCRKSESSKGFPQVRFCKDAYDVANPHFIFICFLEKLLSLPENEFWFVEPNECLPQTTLRGQSQSLGGLIYGSQSEHDHCMTNSRKYHAASYLYEEYGNSNNKQQK